MCDCDCDCAVLTMALNPAEANTYLPPATNGSIRTAAAFGECKELTVTF